MAILTIRRRLALTLRTFIADAALTHLTLNEALEIALSDELEAVLQYLTQSDLPRPKVLGTPHVIGTTRDTCENCGALAGRQLAGAYGVQRFVTGDLVGRDCRPPKRGRR
jgi:hypothetical protein